MSGLTPELVACAIATQAKWQVPASLSLSACGVESAFFTKMPPGSLNGFGIKSLPGQASVSTSTGEQTPSGAGYTIVAGFRVFASVADAFDAYGRLLGLGRPYHDMMTTFLKSPRAPADVQALTNALTGVYATAKNYGAVLIDLQKRLNLYQYDKESTVPNTPAPAAPPAPVSAPTPPVPTVSGSVQADWGSAASQFIAHEEKIIASVGTAAIEGGLKLLPFGAIVQAFVAPTVIEQYLQQGLVALEGILNTQNFTMSDSNTLAAYVVNMFNANETKLIGFLENGLDPLIATAMVKLGLPAPSTL